MRSCAAPGATARSVEQRNIKVRLRMMSDPNIRLPCSVLFGENSRNVTHYHAQPQRHPLGARQGLSALARPPASRRRVHAGGESAGSGPPGPRARSQGVSRLLRRSEEHTSELQSPYDLVCRLLLEKKKR